MAGAPIVSQEPDFQDLFTDAVTLASHWTTSLATARDTGYLGPELIKVENGTFSASSPNFFNLTFSSDNNLENFDTSGSPLQKDNGVVMGYSKKTVDPQEYKLEDVRKAFRLPGLESLGGIIGVVFRMLGQAENLKLVTTRGSGNACWVRPASDQVLEVVTKLAFTLSDTKILQPDELQSIVNIVREVSQSKVDLEDLVPNLKFAPDGFKMILTDFAMVPVDGAEISHNFSITLRFPKIASFVLWVTETHDEATQNNEVTIAVSEDIFNMPENPDSRPDELAKITGIDVPTQKIQPQILPHVWYADLIIGPTSDWSVATIIEINLTGARVPLRLFITYDSGTKNFNGGVLLKGAIPEDKRRMQPDYREYHGLSISVPDKVDLKDVLFGPDFPNGLPTEILEGTVSYTPEPTEMPSAAFATNAGDAVTDYLAIKLRLRVGSQHVSEESHVPARFEWSSADFFYDSMTINGQPRPPDWRVNCKCMLKAEGFEPADLDVDFRKPAAGPWRLRGNVTKLNFGALAKFLDPSASKSLVKVLGALTIKNLGIVFAFDTSADATAFVFSGLIELGSADKAKMMMRMVYQYAGANSAGSIKDTMKALFSELNVIASETIKPMKSKGWSFDARVDASDPDVTMGDIISSITGTEDSGLPSFIADMKVDEAGSNPNLITIKAMAISVPQGTAPDPQALFVFNINLNVLKLSFVQLTGQGDSLNRILRFSLGPLPFIDDIPIVKTLPQPYDLLTYCFIGPGPGVSSDDLEMLNKNVFNTADTKLYYMKTMKGSQAIALRPGHHFLIIRDGKCVLDHVFTTGSSTPRALRRARRAEGSADTEPDSGENPPTKGAVSKNTDFITISGMSLQYKKGTLWMFFDAQIKLGPVQLDLIGFGIGLSLDKFNLKQLEDIFDPKNLRFQLNGLAMNFDQPPIFIGGVFEHEVTDTIDAYRGGIGVKFLPYTFVAVGEYAEVKEKGDEYKSIFIYAKLDGPLISLAIANIKGVRLGFGYNSFVRSPSMEELAEFPLINDTSASGAGNNPLTILTKMRKGDNPWVQLKQEQIWFAFGFTMACFDIITATAVALVQFSPQGVILDVFADVIGQMPPNATRETSIVYVELLMTAKLDFIHDYFAVQAALAPTSFLLVPQCRLYGGFACCSWFGRNQHAGDWVFSIGGYHRQFNVPEHYPRPSRLGIEFTLRDNITIRGEGYFAITPKAVMGGAMIFIQLRVGPVSAHLNAGFDALLEFHPLHYIIDIYVSVGVSCHVHVAFVSFDVSIDIGASLHIEGPEFGGIAHVDFWFFGFDVYFGESPKQPDPLTLAEFYDVVAKAGPANDNATPSEDKVADDLEVMLKFTLEDGAFLLRPADKKTGSPDSAGAGSKWMVKGGEFAFRVASPFAISSAVVEANNEETQFDTREWTDTFGNRHKVVPILSTPMAARTAIQSPLRVRIRQLDGVIDNDPKPWKIEFVVQAVPTALWGDDEGKKTDKLSADQGTVWRNMAVTMKAPDPKLAISKIGKIKATDLGRKKVAPLNKLLDEYRLQATELMTGEFFPKSTDQPMQTTSERMTAWRAIQTAWDESSRRNGSLATALTAAFVTELGWDKPPPDVVQKVTAAEEAGETRKPWDLKWSHPKRLVGDPLKEQQEDGLMNTYLALPRLIAI